VWYNSGPLKRILHFVLIAVLTIGLLAYFVWNSNPRVVWQIIRSADPLWLIAALFVNWCAVWFRTFRWRTILDPDHPPPFYATFFATTIGYFVSTLIRIPADVVRPMLISRRTGLRTSAAFGTVLTERVLDLFSLLVLFVSFVIIHWNDWKDNSAFVVIRSGGIVAMAMLAGLTFFVIGLYFFSGTVRRLHVFFGTLLPKRWNASWLHFFDRFVETLSIAKRPVALLNVLFCTACIWLCLCAQFWLVTTGMHRPLPFDWTFLATGVTTLGLIVPTPGGVGGFHKTCQFVLTNFYDFDVNSSVAAAIVIHLVGSIPVIVTGLILFLREGMHWRDVREMEKVAEQEAPTGDAPPAA
jgi:uncharacterized protein (TIRG00374 family)